VIPPAIREPVLRIMLEHAAGLMHRQGKRWVPSDLQGLLKLGEEDCSKKKDHRT
jgi:hypothetical protein